MRVVEEHCQWIALSHSFVMRALTEQVMTVAFVGASLSTSRFSGQQAFSPQRAHTASVASLPKTRDSPAPALAHLAVAPLISWLSCRVSCFFFPCGIVSALLSHGRTRRFCKRVYGRFFPSCRVAQPACHRIASLLSHVHTPQTQTERRRARCRRERTSRVVALQAIGLPLRP